MRTLPSDVTTEKDRTDGASPFITLEFLFPAERGGTLCLTERGPPQTIAGNVHYPIIKSIARLGSSFGRGPEGQLDVEATEVVLSNAPQLPDGRRFSSYFFNAFSGVVIDVWVNFRKPDLTLARFKRTSCVAQTPSSWTMGEVRLVLKGLWDKWLDKSVLKIIDKLDFPNAEDGAYGKGIPLAIGHSNGARIPGIFLDLTSQLPIVTICEDPPEMPVATIDALYWNGHKILPGNFSVDPQPGLSETLPMYVDNGGTQSNGIGNVYTGQFLQNTFGQDVVQLGRGKTAGANINVPGAPGGPGLRFNLTQPVRWDRPVRINRVSVMATKTDAAYPVRDQLGGGTPTATVNAVVPLRDVLLQVHDPVTIAQAINPGLFSVEAEYSSAQRTSVFHGIVPQQYIGTPFNAGDFNNLPSFDENEVGGLDITAHADLHGWRPVPGVTYYMMLSHPNFGDPDDPTNQWTNVYLDTTNNNRPPDPGSVQPNVYGNALASGWTDVPISGFPYTQRVYSDDNLGQALKMHFDGIEDGRNTGDTEEFGGDGPSVGVKGLFHFEVRPNAARVLMGITMRIQSLAPFQPSSTGHVDLKGSLVVNIKELDSNGHELQQLGSANFAPEDFNGQVGGGIYHDAWAPMSSPLLMEANKRYAVSLDGEMDANGEFSGWGVQGITNPTFTGSGIVGSSHGSVFNAPVSAGGTPVTTSQSEDVFIAMTFHCLQWLQLAHTHFVGGKPVPTVCAMLYYTGDPAVTAGFTPWKWTGQAQISGDVICNYGRPTVAAHALLNRAKVPDDRIDLAGSFLDWETAHPTGSGWLFHGAVIEQQTYKQLLSRMAFESVAAFDWEDDKAQWKPLPIPGSSTPSKTLSLSDMVWAPDDVPAITFMPTDNHDIINLININFEKNYSGGGFFTTERIANDSSIDDDNLGELEKPGLFDMQFIRNTPFAADVGFYYLVLFSVFRRWVTVTTKLTSLEMQKEDIFGLDIDDPAYTVAAGGGTLGGPLGGTLGGGPIKFDGLSGVPFAIRAATYDWIARRIEYLLLEMS